jgi:hypothetical protein
MLTAALMLADQSIVAMSVAMLMLVEAFDEGNMNRIALLAELCKEMMVVVDECYKATGHIRVAKTSYQRKHIETLIGILTGEPPLQLNEFMKELLKDRFQQLTPEQQAKFVSIIGDVDSLDPSFSQIDEAIALCDRTIKMNESEAQK